MEEIKKNTQIEYIRAIAAAGVVSIHTIYSGILYSGDNTNFSVILFFTMLKNMLYWAVPCFAIISGILLLDPAREMSIRKIFSKYIFRVVIILLLFGTAFSWMELFFNEKAINIGQLPRAIYLVLTGQSWAHLWYLYGLITIYLVLPIWRIVSKKCNNVTLFLIIAALAILTELTQKREVGLHLYFLLGEVFRRRAISLTKKRSLIICFVSSLLLLIVVYIHENKIMDLDWLLGYPSFLVMIQSYTVFGFLYEIDDSKMKKIVQKILLVLSKRSFGIYLVHMVFVNFEYKVFKFHLMNSYLSIFVFLALITANIILSTLVAELMSHIPLLKRFI